MLRIRVKTLPWQSSMTIKSLEELVDAPISIKSPSDVDYEEAARCWKEAKLKEVTTLKLFVGALRTIWAP
jgi:hypothetical protein